MDGKLAQGPRIGYDARVGAGLSRGPNLRRKLDAAAWSGTWPAPGSTLDLDFANNRGWVRGYGQGGVMDALTFTRASNGTYVGSDGLLKGAGAHNGALGANSLTFPQDLDNAAWTKGGTSIAANSEFAPDNSYTADAVIEDTTNAAHSVSTVNFNFSGATVTLSFYAKAKGRTVVQFRAANGVLSDNGRANFNLSNGTLGSVDASITASISDAGSGWYRCVCTFSWLVLGNAFLHIQTSTTAARAATFTGDGTSGIYVWGAQLETGSSATTYYPTNVNAPRFDWASTATVATKNLVTQSENVAGWNVGNNTTTSDATTAPDGTTTADFVVPTAVSSSHIATVPTFVLPINGGTYTASVYMKAGGYNYGRIFVTAGLAVYTLFQFDLANGTYIGRSSASTPVNFISASITSVGSGWYRCVVTFSGNSTYAYSFAVTSYPTNDYTRDFTGNGTSGIYVWGAQVEAGDTVTTYQPIAQLTTITTLAATTSSNGILIEESRTNRALWCRDATNAAWVATNVSTAKDQTGIDGIANAASKVTASADNGTLIQTVTLASGSRTGSVYLKRITGTGTVQVSLDGSTWSTVELSSTEWRRVVLSGTVTNPTVGIKLATNGDAVAMDYAQIEDGAFATSPILTTSATATRSADVASMSGATLSWMTQGVGTINCTYLDTPSLNSYWSLSLSSGVNSNFTVLQKFSATVVRLNIAYASASSDIPTATIVNTNGFNTVAVAFANYNSAISIAGQTAIREAVVRARLISSEYGVFRLGSSYNATGQGTTCIKRLFYIPRRLSDDTLSDLSELTT